MTYHDIKDRELGVVIRDMGGRTQHWSVWGLEDTKPPKIHLHRRMQGVYIAELNTGWLIDAPHWRIQPGSLVAIRLAADELGVMYHAHDDEPSPLMRGNAHSGKRAQKSGDARQLDLFGDKKGAEVICLARNADDMAGLEPQGTPCGTCVSIQAPAGGIACPRCGRWLISSFEPAIEKGEV